MNIYKTLEEKTVYLSQVLRKIYGADKSKENTDKQFCKLLEKIK